MAKLHDLVAGARRPRDHGGLRRRHQLHRQHLGDDHRDGQAGEPDRVVTSSVNPSVFGQSVTFTATVSATPPARARRPARSPSTTAPLRSAPRPSVDGSATYTTSALAVGGHTITIALQRRRQLRRRHLDRHHPDRQPGRHHDDRDPLRQPLGLRPVGHLHRDGLRRVVRAAGRRPGQVTFYDGTTAVDTETLKRRLGRIHDLGLVARRPFDHGGLRRRHRLHHQHLGRASPRRSTRTAATTLVSTSVNPSVFGQSVTFTATVIARHAGQRDAHRHRHLLRRHRPPSAPRRSAAARPRSPPPHWPWAVTPITRRLRRRHQLHRQHLDVDQPDRQAGESRRRRSALRSIPSVYGQSVTFTATVTPRDAGTRHADRHVTFYDGTTAIDTATLVDGSATLHDIGPGGRGPLDHVAVRRRHQLQRQHLDRHHPDGQPGQHHDGRDLVGESVDLRPVGDVHGDGHRVAAPGSGTPTGQVTFYDGTTAIDTETLTGGTASYTTSALAIGGHSITAQYLGDTDFTASTSTAITQTVNAPPPATLDGEVYNDADGSGTLVAGAGLCELDRQPHERDHDGRHHHDRLRRRPTPSPTSSPARTRSPSPSSRATSRPCRLRRALPVTAASGADRQQPGLRRVPDGHGQRRGVQRPR